MVNSHGKLPQAKNDFDWLMLPITTIDIIVMAFDWLTVPTTANQIIEPPAVNFRGKLPQAKNDFDWLMLPITTMTSLLWHLIG